MKAFAKILAIVALFCVVLSSCGTRKNTPYSRKYQAFITRYNVYFNGDEHFKQTLKEMESKYEDEYSQRVFMHPAEAYNSPKSPQPQGSFDRSIEKAQKAIQLHSIKKKPKKKSGKSQDEAYKAWMKREEYNPFLHNAWMMMARSQYYKGDFSGAASTFSYISKHFSWLPATVTEARLWEARSYCAMDWLFEAETILKRIKPETDLTNNTLKGLYYFTYADYYVLSNDNAKAIPMLVDALKYAKGPQRTRLRFLLGQLYSAEGRKKEAYEVFKKVSGTSSASYRTQFNARIKQSEVFEGENIEPEVKSLRRMTRYDRNKEYLDQIYYAIGNLYLSRRDTTNAIDNYKLAIEKSTRNGFDKALVQITLGQLYFDRHQYYLAQPCYSEALPLLPETFANYALLKRRSDVLDELAVYAGNVELQDSLLRLAEMTPEQQLAVVNKIIEELRKKEKEEEEEARRAEYLAEQDAKGSQLNNNNKAPSTFTMNGDDSWYFYNSQVRNSGKTEFQRRWGSRKLEDDWRRRNKMTFSMDEFKDDDDDGEESDDTEGEEGGEGEEANDSINATAASDPHNPEFYLKDIPKTEAEKATANEIIQEGLYNMGLILKDKLEDYPAAIDEWDRLLTRYPDNVYRLDVYYNMYLMYMRENNLVAAEKWRQLLLSDFPESKEGLALQDPSFIDNLRAMDSVQEGLYEKTLDNYLNNHNESVHEAYDYMMKTYPMSKIMPKFMFLHALAYVTEKKPEEFSNALKELLERYPTTDITPLATAYLRGMQQGRELHASASGNMRGMLWDIKLSSDSVAAGGSDTPFELDLNPDSPQLLVLLFPTDSVQPNQLLYDIARHNFSTFVVRDFDLEPMQFGRLGLLIIKGFNNTAEVDHYRRLLAADKNLELPASVRPVTISVKDFDTMLKQGRSFEEYFRLVDDKNYSDHEAMENPPAEEPEKGTKETEDSKDLNDSKDINEPAKAPEKPAEQPASEKQPTPPTQPKLPTEPEKPAKAPEKPAEQPAAEKQPTPPTQPKLPTEPEKPAKAPEKPAAEPVKPPEKPKTPVLPDYPTGSEDDPLLD